MATTTDYGSDLSCVTDLDPVMAEVTGNLAVAQAVVRRWQTPRGQLADDPFYGYDLIGFLNDDLSPSDIARINAGAAAEALKDERVFSATVTVVLTGNVLIVTAQLVGAQGPFTLVASVSNITVQILQVTPS